MIPGLDMANHVTGCANQCGIDVAPGGKSVAGGDQKDSFAAVISAGAAIEEGSEVLIDYMVGSRRTSWDLLVQVGGEGSRQQGDAHRETKR